MPLRNIGTLDAASAPVPACSCPPAEPPLSGKRIVHIEKEVTLAPVSVTIEDAYCPPYYILLTGTCTRPTNSTYGVSPHVVNVQESRPYQDEWSNSTPYASWWRCVWGNPSDIDGYVVKAIARCLSIENDLN